MEYTPMGSKIGGLHVEQSSRWTAARSSSEDECLTAAWAAFALDNVPGADRIHWTAPPHGTKAAQAGSPVHRAEMAALVLLTTTAGSRAVAAGSKVAAGAVR